VRRSGLPHLTLRACSWYLIGGRRALSGLSWFSFCFFFSGSFFSEHLGVVCKGYFNQMGFCYVFLFKCCCAKYSLLVTCVQGRNGSDSLLKRPRDIGGVMSNKKNTPVPSHMFRKRQKQAVSIDTLQSSAIIVLGTLNTMKPFLVPGQREDR
jgi:hypothetical protein